MRRTLTHRGRRLVSLDRVLEAAGLDARSDAGLREIAIGRIVGSASQNKTRDFDPSFLPTSRRLRDRWARMYEAVLEGAELPPIDVYQVGDRYYVSDGHHRVSVLRRLGRERVKARVTEVRTRAPLEAGVDAVQLLRAAEYAHFLEVTQLDRSRPAARLEVSRLGRYEELLAHIRGHAYFLGLERGSEVSLPEAAASWYDAVYLPIAEVVRRHEIPAQLPGWTETDLYVEITRRWLEISEAGAQSGPHEAAHAVLEESERRPPRAS